MPDANKEFIRAAKSGNVEKLQVLFKADPKVIHARDSDRSTALHCATWKGHQSVVDFLLKAGAGVNLHSNNEHWGTTPLHAAAHAHQAAIAKMLIDNGSDVNARDRAGRTPSIIPSFTRRRRRRRCWAKPAQKSPRRGEHSIIRNHPKGGKL